MATTTSLMSFVEIARRLFKRLDAAVEGGKPAPQVGTVYVEMGYKLSENPASRHQPDVSLTHAGQEGDEYVVGAPLIAFEIASPNDMALDLNLKVTEYLANGAEEVWVIYPNQRHALVYERSEAVRQESRAIRSGLLPGIEIPFDQIF